MLPVSWVNRWFSRSRTRCIRIAPKERRLRLMRLEQRRVLNADFTFAANASLSLSQVDGDLTVREASHRVEFDLTGSVWQDAGSNGAFTVDNSAAGHSILSIDRDDLGA